MDYLPTRHAICGVNKQCIKGVLESCMHAYFKSSLNVRYTIQLAELFLGITSTSPVAQSTVNLILEPPHSDVYLTS